MYSNIPCYISTAVCSSEDAGEMVRRLTFAFLGLKIYRTFVKQILFNEKKCLNDQSSIPGPSHLPLVSPISPFLSSSEEGNTVRLTFVFSGLKI